MNTVAPLTDPHPTTGYSIVITLINNINARPATGGEVSMVGYIVWPATPEGRAARDRVYDALPTANKNTKKPLEASIDSVGPGSFDLEGTRRIPAETAERLLGRTLNDALARVVEGTPPQALELDAFTRAVNDARASRSPNVGEQ